MGLEMNIKFNWRTPPKAAQIAICVVPPLLIIGLCIFFVVLPKKDKLDKLDKQIQTQQTNISKSQAMAAKLEVLKKENVKLESKLIELEEQLPEESEVSSLLKQVTDLTIESGLRLMSWQPATNKRNHPSGIVYEIPFTVSLTGSYHNLGLFFSNLTKLERIVNIKSITLSGPVYENDEVKLTVTFQGVTFVAVPEKRLS